MRPALWRLALHRCSAASAVGRPAPAAHPRMAGRNNAARGAATEADSLAGLPEYEFEVLEERQLHRRFLTLYNRRIRFPAAHGREAVVHDYDVIGHPQADFHFAVVFPFHRDPSAPGGGHVTLLREHCQGPNQMMFVLPTGCFSPQKHVSRLACGQAELSEEAHLRGGEWHQLVADGHPGIAEVKWCANRFTPFLCVDPQADEQPGVRDAEEFIEIHRVPVAQLRRVMASGDMLLPSVTTCFLALERLQALSVLAS